MKGSGFLRLRLRLVVVGVVLFVGLALSWSQEPSGSSRKLDDVDEAACEGGGFFDPLDLQATWAGVIYLLGILYTFQGIAMVCEDYFVASLNRLVEELNVSPDVAGATFMAAGTSAPELFAALVGLFVSESSDTGVGTVVGSAVFNILIIIGGSLMVIPGGVILIELAPLARDTFFYLASLVALYYAFKDGEVTVAASGAMVAVYGLYVFVNAFWGQILAASRRLALSGGGGALLVNETTALVAGAGAAAGPYGEAPTGEAARAAFATRLSLMSHTRQSVVSHFYGLREGEEALEFEVAAPLLRTYSSLHPKERSHVEEIFEQAAAAETFSDDDGGAGGAADGKYNGGEEEAGGGGGEVISVPLRLLTVTLRREAVLSSATGPGTVWDDLFQALALCGDDASLTLGDFMPMYMTWNQCGKVWKLRPLYTDDDVACMRAAFAEHQDPAAAADAGLAAAGALSYDSVRRCADELLGLSGEQKWSLFELFDLSRTGDVSLPCFLMTFALWLGYRRALDAHAEGAAGQPAPWDSAAAVGDGAAEGAASAAASVTATAGDGGGKRASIMNYSVVHDFMPGDEVDLPHSPFVVPKAPGEMFMFAVGFPFAVAYYLTILDCRRKAFHRFYPVTLLLSICWLGLLVTFMISWAEKMGCLWGIHPSLLGMTLCAAGTSMPDCLASMIVARQGEGMMAVSNALGSNIFDILFGLGFPFLLKTAVVSSGRPVAVSAEGIVGSVLLLLVLQAVFTVAVVWQRCRISRPLGWAFVAAYVGFLVYCYCSLQLELWG
ncbi:unnamed protein product [Phaeothamnion confervicola]